MYGQGYVGNAHDSQRIRRQEKQRDDARKQFEALHKQSEDKVSAAGLRQFGASKKEVSGPGLLHSVDLLSLPGCRRQCDRQPEPPS